jgi:hypothetical protein
VWDEVERQSVFHNFHSDTSALDDVQEQLEDRIAAQLDQVQPVPNQIGVICTIGDQVVGMDLFDKPSTLEKYLRGIIAGHALDATAPRWTPDSAKAIERFLAQVDTTVRDSGRGVGLGEEILLRWAVTGIGLSYEECLVHLAAFPAPV